MIVFEKTRPVICIRCIHGALFFLTRLCVLLKYAQPVVDNKFTSILHASAPLSNYVFLTPLYAAIFIVVCVFFFFEAARNYPDRMEHCKTIKLQREPSLRELWTQVRAMNDGLDTVVTKRKNIPSKKQIRLGHHCNTNQKT